MVQPLTKRRSTGDRALYTRSMAVEAEIAALLDLDWATLIARSASSQMSDEALLHLIRKAHREGAEDERDKLLRPFLKRCRARLLKVLPDGRAANAADLRSEALGRLGELIAEDGQGESPDALDYYEVGMAGALAALREDLIRTQTRQTSRNVQLPHEVELDAEEAPRRDRVAERARDLTTMASTQEQALVAREFVEAFKDLTDDERMAVLLRHMGYEEESKTDPDKRTIATICGVTGRAIRYRLTNAARKLSRLKEVQ